MRHIKLYKIYENDGVCTTCNGSGKAYIDCDVALAYPEFSKCKDCDGTGELNRQIFNKGVQEYVEECRKEFDLLLNKYEIKHNTFINTDVQKYSDNYFDIEKIEMNVLLYSAAMLSKEFLEDIGKKYVDYNILFNAYGDLYLTVYKLY